MALEFFALDDSTLLCSSLGRPFRFNVNFTLFVAPDYVDKSVIVLGIGGDSWFILGLRDVNRCMYE